MPKPLKTPSGASSRRTASRFYGLLALLALAAVVSCASAPEYPTYPPPTSATLPVDQQVAFRTIRDLLLSDPRLEIHTIDTAGRIVAREKTSGFIFLQNRTILDFFLQPADTNQTKITMFLRAEKYDSGGLTMPAGWYPSSNVDTFLGEDVLGLIEQATAQAAK